MASIGASRTDIKKGLLDRSIFVDEAIYQQELEQIFGRCWLFVGHESQVPKPNDFVAAYMGEDPILITRDSKGKLHAFLNMCRHRGNRICRADAGNAPSFMCTYHGWTFSTDGKLVGVPGYKEAYFEELDRSQWGLVEAGQIDTYKKLIFATWDKQAPSLIDFLGDAAWFLDLLVDRREGGTELVTGVHRWVMDTNWKFGADNFGGDGYHGAVTHGSMSIVGLTRPRVATPELKYGRTVSPGNGHAVLGGWTGPELDKQFSNARSDKLVDYYFQHLPELEQRLGPVRARQARINVANLFPNCTWHPGPMIRAWQPRAPTKTEVWSYCIMDKAAPENIKAEMRHKYQTTFGPGGAMEQDDLNNWSQCTASGKTLMGKRHPMNIQMGVGHETTSEILPGTVATSPTEMNHRAFYSKWAELMDAPSWGQVSISPRTKV